MDDAVWVSTVFSKNRERLIAHDAVVALFNEIVAQTDAEGLLRGDKGFDAKEFIGSVQELKVMPHIAKNISGRRSAVPDAVPQTPEYAVSLQKRKLIEQGFGWAKTVGLLRQVKVRGLAKVDQCFVLAMTCYNLVRMRTLGFLRQESIKTKLLFPPAKGRNHPAKPFLMVYIRH